MKRRLYITTAIPYVNAAPHIGFALEVVQTDTIARWYRLHGAETFFLTGTDENSLKNVQAAQKEGIPTENLVARNAGKFEALREPLGLSFDEFIRTTEGRHFTGAQKLWELCAERGDIYQKHYQGLYCVGCETFYKENELEDGKCPEHGTVPDTVEEENYFFKLSRYVGELKRRIESDELRIVPVSRKNEVLQVIASGLEDFSISRSVARAHGWGVPVPGDDSQVMYVWFDALSNYLTALDFHEERDAYRKWWAENPNRIHVIGKGILRFHALYWPAMLLSAKLELPKELFVHGYVTVDGKKISKSLGNVIDPFAIVAKYGTDPVRLYLLSAIPATDDGDFSEDRLRTLYTAKLANGLGNLLSRVLTLVERHYGAKVPPHKANEHVLYAQIEASWKSYDEHMRAYELDRAIAEVFVLEAASNQLVDASKLWQTVKTDSGQAGAHLAILLETLRHMAWMLTPFLPDTADRMLAQLDPEGRDAKRYAEGGLEAIRSATLEEGAPVKKGKPLFPRLIET